MREAEIAVRSNWRPSKGRLDSTALDTIVQCRFMPVKVGQMDRNECVSHEGFGAPWTS